MSELLFLVGHKNSESKSNFKFSYLEIGRERLWHAWVHLKEYSLVQLLRLPLIQA